LLYLFENIQINMIQERKNNMIPMKEEVLLKIYDAFEKWVDEDLVCQKGCATCKTNAG